MANIPNFTLEGINQALQGQRVAAQSQASAQDQTDFAATQDWRVRVRLAQGAKYLYNSSNPGILAPLRATDGVIFPYTPQIAVNYSANYDAAHPVHSNYKIYQYQNSSVDSINITTDFTCQDTSEAEYLLAVIHFFRSMTKMFYGQDTEPRNGTPPPLCFIDGLGAYQFSYHPMAITSFNYNLPPDVDYIRTTITAAPTAYYPTNRAIEEPISGLRLLTLGLGLIFNGKKNNNPGVGSSVRNNSSSPSNDQSEITYVPSKITLTIGCIPIMSRNQVSNNFSLENYASGQLLRGSQQKSGGMW